MVYLRIKDNTDQAKALLQMLKTMHFVEFIDGGDIPNSETIKAMIDAKTGRVNKYKSSNEMFSNLKKKASV